MALGDGRAAYLLLRPYWTSFLHLHKQDLLWDRLQHQSSFYGKRYFWQWSRRKRNPSEMERLGVHGLTGLRGLWYFMTRLVTEAVLALLRQAKLMRDCHLRNILPLAPKR